MENRGAIDRAVWRKEIEQAGKSLIELLPRTVASAPNPLQRINAVIHHAIGFLIVPLEALEKCDDEWCTSLISAINRFFFSEMHSATEAGLIIDCKEKNLKPRASQDKAEKIFEEMGNRISEPEKDELRHLIRKGPGFMDYVNLALKNSELHKDPKRRKDQMAIWRDYFEAFSIIRNKSSHSDGGLTSAQKTKLTESVFKPFIKDNDICSSPAIYPLLCDHIIKFFEQLGYKSAQHSIS